MKVYLAARYSRREELCRYREQLHNQFVLVTSRWLNGDHHMPDHSPSDYQHAENQRFAKEDLEDLEAADVVISFTEPARTGPSRGGRHVEFGYAQALNKTCVVIGHRENVFHFLPDVVFFPSWDGVVAWILEV